MRLAGAPADAAAAAPHANSLGEPARGAQKRGSGRPLTACLPVCTGSAEQARRPTDALAKQVALTRAVGVLGVGVGARGVALRHATAVGADAEDRRCDVDVGGRNLSALRSSAGHLADAVALRRALGRA